MDYRALDVANYIVYYALKIGKPINHLQLQKILYYLEALWLTSKGDSLFVDNIEMWRLGPVIPNVYHEYKIFGSSSITSIPKEFNLKDGNVFAIEYKDFDPSSIRESTKKIIEPYTEKLLQFNGFSLVDKTHRHQLWKEREYDIYSGERGIKYDKTAMKTFFENHKEELEFIQ